jgi:hypothetical protein
MKRNGFQWLLLLFLVSPLQAAPNFWANPSFTPTPVPPPQIQEWGQMSEDLQPTATPVLAPKVQIATPTPTPVPGISPLNPTQAALFSVVLPGSGHVYAGDPLKGILFASLFGVGLWQTLDNLQLVHNSSGDLVAKNETAGNLFGLATLAAYGFGIQDALNTAVNYNKRNNLTLSLGLNPEPNASLAFNF